MDEPARALAEDLVEAMRPLDVRVRAMFGGYTLYLDDNVVGLVNDGRVFIKRSSALASNEDVARSAVEATAEALPMGRRRT